MIASLLLAAAIATPPPPPLAVEPACSPCGNVPAPPITASDEWQKAVVMHVYRAQQYPIEALRERISGQVRVRFQVDRDGLIHNARIDQSSGSAVLDQSALDTLKRIGRVPPPPAARHQEKVNVILPVRFAIAE